jgi:hypothetical protein
MKIAKYLGLCALFVVVFMVGLWVCAPWDECGALAFEEIRAAAARKGYYVTCENMRHEGLFPPLYRFAKVDVEGPMTKVTFSEATVKLAPIRSLMSRKAAFHAEFSGAGVKYIPKNEFSVKGGEMNVRAGASVVLLDNIAVDGDLKMTGDMTLDVMNQVILESSVVMTVPQEINIMLNTPIMGRFIESVSPGEWRIKPSANQNK